MPILVGAAAGDFAEGILIMKNRKVSSADSESFFIKSLWRFSQKSFTYMPHNRH